MLSASRVPGCSHAFPHDQFIYNRVIAALHLSVRGPLTCLKMPGYSEHRHRVHTRNWGPQPRPSPVSVQEEVSDPERKAILPWPMGSPISCLLPWTHCPGRLHSLYLSPCGGGFKLPPLCHPAGVYTSRSQMSCILCSVEELTTGCPLGSRAFAWFSIYTVHMAHDQTS